MEIQMPNDLISHGRLSCDTWLYKMLSEEFFGKPIYAIAATSLKDSFLGDYEQTRNISEGIFSVCLKELSEEDLANIFGSFEVKVNQLILVQAKHLSEEEQIDVYSCIKDFHYSQEPFPFNLEVLFFGADGTVLYWFNPRRKVNELEWFR